jgi:hypothetical protein
MKFETEERRSGFIRASEPGTGRSKDGLEQDAPATGKRKSADIGEVYEELDFDLNSSVFFRNSAFQRLSASCSSSLITNHE